MIRSRIHCTAKSMIWIATLMINEFDPVKLSSKALKLINSESLVGWPYQPSSPSMLLRESPILAVYVRNALNHFMRLSMKPTLYRDFFPQMLIFFLQKCISHHDTKQYSKFQSDPISNCFTIDV